jgi:aryl-alcohol dehydrogenase-like predicted oxidoreductase
MTSDIDEAGTITYAGLTVPRLGLGAMRLLGPGLSEPVYRDTGLQLLRRAVELGIRIIDTAWYYGHDVSNRLIAEALWPYPPDLVLATKLGARPATGRWPRCGRRSCWRATAGIGASCGWTRCR